MFQITNKKQRTLKYPSYLNAKTPAPKDAFSSLQETMKMFHDLGNDDKKQYYWQGSEISRVLYQNYLFDKYGVKCRFNTKELKEYDLKISNEESKNYTSRHTKLFSRLYGFHLKVYEYDNKKEEEKSEEEYQQYLQLISGYLVECIKKNKKTIIPMVVALDGAQHANLIIFRNYNHTIEVFEPHGQIIGAGEYSDHLTEQIQRRYEEFTSILNGELKKHSMEKFILISSEQTCPQLEGIQIFEGFSKIKKQRTEGGGYCQLWSLFIAELALLNQDKTLSQINSIILESKDQTELRDYLRRVARGMSLYMSDIVKRYYSIFGINMAFKEIFKNYRKVNKGFKNIKSLEKYFKIYVLIDYELHDRNMTPEQLLKEYEKMNPKKVKLDKMREKELRKLKDHDISHLILYPSFVTDVEVHKASVKILKAMVKSEPIVPDRRIIDDVDNQNDEEPANNNSNNEEENQHIINLVKKIKTPKSKSKSNNHKKNEVQLEEIKEYMIEIIRKMNVHTLKDIVFNNILQDLNKKFGEKKVDKYYDFLHEFFENYFIPSEYYVKKGKKSDDTSKKTNKIKTNIRVGDIIRTKKIIDLPKNTRRCPRGYRKHSKNKCFKFVDTPTTSNQINQDLHNTKKRIIRMNKTKKRCPNGFRKDKLTGLCQSKSSMTT